MIQEGRQQEQEEDEAEVDLADKDQEMEQGADESKTLRGTVENVRRDEAAEGQALAPVEQEEVDSSMLPRLLEDEGAKKRMAEE